MKKKKRKLSLTPAQINKLESERWRRFVWLEDDIEITPPKQLKKGKDKK